jgi:hypothetical protein
MDGWDVVTYSCIFACVFTVVGMFTSPLLLSLLACILALFPFALYLFLSSFLSLSFPENMLMLCVEEE